MPAPYPQEEMDANIETWMTHMDQGHSFQQDVRVEGSYLVIRILCMCGEEFIVNCFAR